ncbi:MAG: energy transducer TonB [Dysgonomonas sp.]
MTRDINLNSSEWCNMIFDGKNKAYGAYKMRQDSSKRHLIAFGFIILFTAFISLLPSIMSAVDKNSKEILGGVDGPTVLSDFDQPKEEEEVIVHLTQPELPPLINTERFTPPSIVDDEEVNSENEMSTQEELRESTGVISVITNVTDVTVGVDPADVLRENRQITGGGTQSDVPFKSAEVMPQFPGGKIELMKYISNSLRYPAIAVDNGIEGRVVLRFVVGKDGKISDIEVLKGIDPSCDNEAVRVVKSMPKWVPGSQNGNPVAVYFTLPVSFQIQR